MRVAFLFLPISICAGIVIATQDHGHDQNKSHHQVNHSVDVSDELHQGNHDQEGIPQDTFAPSLLQLLEDIVNTDLVCNLLSLLTRSREAAIPSVTEASNHTTPHHSQRREYSRHDKFGKAASKEKTT
ncbi:hypothetical protein Trydic_g2354 [Trypoxylus dichotomus]